MLIQLGIVFGVFLLFGSVFYYDDRDVMPEQETEPETDIYSSGEDADIFI